MTKSKLFFRLFRLSEEANNLIGHKNNRQKIKHFQKVKEENLRLLEELTRLKAMHERDSSRIKQLEKLTISASNVDTLRKPLCERNE